MYEVSVVREFDARHYLVGGDWGKENRLHDHHYRVEAVLAGEALDSSGYLVDITLLDKAMDGLVRFTAGKTLNHLQEFAGLNPSLERFSRFWCRSLLKSLQTERLISIRIQIWENENAWASYLERV